MVDFLNKNTAKSKKGGFFDKNTAKSKKRWICLIKTQPKVKQFFFFPAVFSSHFSTHCPAIFFRPFFPMPQNWTNRTGRTGRTGRTEPDSLVDSENHLQLNRTVRFLKNANTGHDPTMAPRHLFSRFRLGFPAAITCTCTAKRC